ncbi:zinc-binding loop region of homing endonuclease-domain-containing protein [Lipomyces starkeyi]
MNAHNLDIGNRIRRRENVHRYDELRATLHGCSYDVSHLCHHRKCFNPEHLVVKSRLNNIRRQHLKEVTMPNSAAQESTEETLAPNPDGKATVSNNADADAGKLGHITPEMAQQLINKYRAVTTDLGCWQSRLKPDSKRGYCRLDLSTTLHVRPQLHHLALIADNRSAELESALSQKSYCSVSHLCRNRQCFNPQHLIVESESDNRKRQACNGKTIVVCEGFTDHPCVHGDVDGLHKCMLPVQHRQHSMSNSEDPLTINGRDSSARPR